MLSTPQLSTNIANPKRLYTKPLHEPRALQVNKDISNSQLLQSRSLPGACKAEGFAVVGVARVHRVADGFLFAFGFGFKYKSHILPYKKGLRPLNPKP